MNPTWLLIFVVWFHNGQIESKSITAPSYQDCQAARPLIERDLNSEQEKQLLAKEHKKIDKVKVLPCLEIEP